MKSILENRPALAKEVNKVADVYKRQDYTDVEDEYESALASGPMLLMEGKVCSFPQDAAYTQRMARSVIGITAQGKMMLLTIDSAITGNADGATLEEAAFIAKTLGMKNAVCLADGSSSTLWTLSLIHICVQLLLLNLILLGKVEGAFIEILLLKML